MKYGWLAQSAARAGHLVALVSPGPDCVRASSLTSLHQMPDAPGYLSGREAASQRIKLQFIRTVTIADAKLNTGHREKFWLFLAFQTQT